MESLHKGKKWVANFHTMCSKDNDNYPKYLRELFERPYTYDINGRRSSPHPYGWRSDTLKVLQFSQSAKIPKIPLINSVAFTNFKALMRPTKSTSLCPSPLRKGKTIKYYNCLLYTSPSPRDS